MGSGISSSFVRDINSSLVLSNLRQKRIVSRSELAKATNLSYPTIAAIVKYFLEEGLVSEARIGKYRGGRRPMLIKFNPDARFVVGVSLRGSGTDAVLADLDGEFVSDILKNEDPPPEKDVGANMVRVIKELQRRTGFQWEKVIGIGASMRGSFDTPNRLYYYPRNRNPIPLLDILESNFPVPIVLERNSSLAALSQHVHGYTRGVRNLVFVNVDSGVSAGMIIEGQICRGSLGNAGEFGHVSVDPNGDICPTCGRVGCLENIASLPALVAAARRRGFEFPAGGDSSDDIEYLAGRANAGDTMAGEVFARGAWALSEAISDLVNTINPEVVVLGGRVVLAYPSLTVAVEKMVKEKCWPYSRQHLRITAAGPEEHPFLHGAVTFVLERVFLPPEVSVQTGVLRDVSPGEGY